MPDLPLQDPTPPQPERSFWRYCLGLALLAMSPTLVAMAIQLAVNLINHINPLEASRYAMRPDLLEVFGTLLYAPVSETVILALVVTLLRKAGLPRVAVSLVSALGWGALHWGLQGWVKFLPAAWGFFFFTWAYQVWLEQSWKKAFAAALVPHMIVNATLMAVVFAYA